MTLYTQVIAHQSLPPIISEQKHRSKPSIPGQAPMGRHFQVKSYARRNK